MKLMKIVQYKKTLNLSSAVKFNILISTQTKISILLLHEDTDYISNKRTCSEFLLEPLCHSHTCLWCVLILSSDWSVGTGVADMDGACEVEFTLTPSDKLWTVRLVQKLNNIQQREEKWNKTKKKSNECNSTDGGKFHLQQQIMKEEEQKTVTKKGNKGSSSNKKTQAVSVKVGSWCNRKEGSKCEHVHKLVQ